MPIIIHQTSLREGEPWLLERDALSRLDEILHSAWLELEANRLHQIEEHKANYIQQHANKELHTPDELSEHAEQFIPWKLKQSERKLIVRLKDGSRIEADSFDEAATQPQVRRHFATGFAAKIHSGLVDVSVGTGGWHNQLEIDVNPDSDQIAQNIFGRLAEWRDSIRPNRWLRIWKEWSWIAALLIFLAILIFASTYSNSDRDKTVRILEAEATALLQNGITQDEQLKAIELLLALDTDTYLQSGYNSRTPTKVMRLRVFSIALSILCLVWLLPPRNTIGLGPGQQRIKLWRWWIRIVLFVVPITLFSSFALDPLLSWIRSLFIPS